MPEWRLPAGLYCAIIAIVVLGGALAVPCNPQSAIAGLNSFPRSACAAPLVQYGVLTARSYAIEPLRTWSGPDGSSHKRYVLCAVGLPGSSFQLNNEPLRPIREKCTTFLCKKGSGPKVSGRGQLSKE